ncbi:MAG: hypothetical protein ACW98A_10280 [Candidatus Hodarchaeales archaeon]
MAFQKIQYQIYDLIDSGRFNDAKHLITANDNVLETLSRNYLKAYVFVHEGKFNESINLLNSVKNPINILKL